jgi:hypothetical protein
MRSGHLVMDYSPATTAALASRYLREILAVDPAGPYLVGGECQGSILAHEIARQLQASGRVVALLALVDTGFWDIFGGRPYPGRVACFAGVRSRFNPLRKFRSPERGWRKLLPAGVRFALLPADHLEIFVEPSAPELAAQLRACTEWALASPAVPSGAAAGALPLGAYLPEIAAPASLTLAVGAEHVVSLRIRNSGAVDWPADAGIALGNHWLRSDGEVAVWADGRCDLAEAIPAGASASFELRIRAPAEPGRYLIEFDLVEEGVAWFKDKAGKSAFTEALVAPQRRFSLLRPSSWLQPASPPPSSRPVDTASGS